MDIDFLVSDKKGFSDLRQLIRRGGFPSLIQPERNQIDSWTPFSQDQYAFRGRVEIANHSIKFEIVFESRIDLSSPIPNLQLAGTPTLNRVDLAATKMLANSDRWLDDATFGRDILDLAFLDLKAREFDAALHVTAEAMGDIVRDELTASLRDILERPGRLDRCINALSFAPSKAAATQKLNHLRNLLNR